MQVGEYDNALIAASSRGHEAIVKLLLDKEADVNAQGGIYGNALQAASYRGHEGIVKLLLDKGAEVNMQGGKYGSALQAASSEGHEAIVKLLLDMGADVNAKGEEYGSALQAAFSGGHEAIVRLLVDKGADVNAQGQLRGPFRGRVFIPGSEPFDCASKPSENFLSYLLSSTVADELSFKHSRIKTEGNFSIPYLIFQAQKYFPRKLHKSNACFVFYRAVAQMSIIFAAFCATHIRVAWFI
ncbi:hypothetical protein CVT26_010270 [Gymnopilus dilepis]|uniref:Uncharacterized protein n=1 Tax=Gymnopilus dilepis TaxID=231916 RepID=A0A409XAE7_9AGAR|nr:hypothetical protein CVT26_010270 [Gymnopilus dilepis]